MVKLQNPTPHLQRGDSRALQVKTPVTGLRPTKCHKCSFAAPGFPVVSFCLEVKVFDRSGKKLQNFFVRVVFWREFSAGKRISFSLLPCGVQGYCSHYFWLNRKKQDLSLFPSSHCREGDQRPEQKQMNCSLWRPRECIYLVIIYFPQCSAEHRLLIQKYLQKKRTTPSPLCFPYVHSQVVLCAPVPP